MLVADEEYLNLDQVEKEFCSARQAYTHAQQEKVTKERDLRPNSQEPLLLLGLWAVLAPVQCSPGHPSWRYSSSEVVTPRKELHRDKSVQVLGWLCYSLCVAEQRHVIHMWHKKLFSPRHLPLMTQDDQGALQIDYPIGPSDCYYLGYLEEIPLSMVTLDTCYGGLEGIMNLDDLTYETKTLMCSERLEHIVYQIVADASGTGPAFRPDHKEDRQPLPPEVDVSVAPRAGNLQCAEAEVLEGAFRTDLLHLVSDKLAL
ncbi:PREDICTED: disintegrin and metalloproteinase domain-containing protein 21-like [Bison bison bison]|uniref:Disintegrin and metalloproteinase domain-containing protein 21-like n=1 Tax=Bison bison bison TaxID=43346 RepID=A0A6P3HES2_BISBB|nr:PREDICTED: disintegrin and metalloproteinase domain-containing protein 21-like [Bison bison bison]